MSESTAVQSSHNYSTVDEDREEIIIVTTDQVRTPRRDVAGGGDDDIDVTTVTNSPNGASASVMLVTPIKSVLTGSETGVTIPEDKRNLPSRITPSTLNLDKEARTFTIRKIISSATHLQEIGGGSANRQAIDHDYASSLSRLSGTTTGLQHRYGPALLRQNQSTGESSASALQQAAMVTATNNTSIGGSATASGVGDESAAASAASATHRRKRKGDSVEAVADSDSDDEDEAWFRSAKIEYTTGDGSGGLNEYACPKCPAQFESRVGLTNHMKLHGAMKRFPCDLCDFCCTNKKTMRQHRRIHGITRRAPAAKRILLSGGEPTTFASMAANATAAPVGVPTFQRDISGSAKFASNTLQAGTITSTTISANSSRKTQSAASATLRGSPLKRSLAVKENFIAEGVISQVSAAPDLTLQTDNIDDSPPKLRAVGIAVGEELQHSQVPASQIRAIDFALKLNLDEDGNPLPLPARNLSPTAAQSSPPSAYFSTLNAAKSPTRTRLRRVGSGEVDTDGGEEDEMPMLPLEMKNEETSDDEEIAEDAAAGGISSSARLTRSAAAAKTPNSAASKLSANRVKCKDCPFGARSVARLQPHLSGHTRETGYKCQFCSFKSESLGFLKRHMNMHEGCQYTWPPEYVGDTREHMEKLLANERNRLALERRGKTTTNADTSKSINKNADCEEKVTGDDLYEDDTDINYKGDATSKKRGAKSGTNVAANTTATNSQASSTTSTLMARRSTRTTRLTASASITGVASVVKDSVSVVKDSTPASAAYNQCAQCDYKVAARAPAAVMARHMQRRHRDEGEKTTTTAKATA